MDVRDRVDDCAVAFRVVIGKDADRYVQVVGEGGDLAGAAVGGEVFEDLNGVAAFAIGGSGEILRAGGRIRDTESGLDLEELVSQYIHGKVK